MAFAGSGWATGCGLRRNCLRRRGRSGRDSGNRLQQRLCLGGAGGFLGCLFLAQPLDQGGARS